MTLVADDETAAPRYEITGTWALLLLRGSFQDMTQPVLVWVSPEAALEYGPEYRPSFQR